MFGQWSVGIRDHLTLERAGRATLRAPQATQGAIDGSYVYCVSESVRFSLSTTSWLTGSWTERGIRRVGGLVRTARGVDLGGALDAMNAPCTGLLRFRVRPRPCRFCMGVERRSISSS